MPAKVLSLLSPVETVLVNRWWGALDDAVRHELLAAWSPRASNCTYSLVGQGARSTWERLSIRVVAQPEYEAGDGLDDPEILDWPVDLYEYLVGHEVEFSGAFRFHICSRHEAGRQAGRDGQIPTDFRCPIGEVRCPLANVSRLARGSCVRFFVKITTARCDPSAPTIPSRAR